MAENLARSAHQRYHNPVDYDRSDKPADKGSSNADRRGAKS